MNLETLVVPVKMNTSSFNPVVAGVMAGITAAVGAMVGAIAMTAKWASELDSLGDVMGGTNKELAAMAYVARVSGVGVEKLAKANTIMEKGLLTAKGRLDTVGKALKTYGINVKDANGVVKTQAMLTEEVSKKYQELGTQQERVNFLTDIYGKSGAQLVDFFDTLAQQGGIDAVAQKVTALGLAIDSGRYEQFNRNLEELKMIGLSLAVAFTEKVMPFLEKFLGWFTTFIPNAKKALEKGGIGGLFDFIVDELRKLDVKLAEAIDKVDWSSLGTKFGAKIDEVLSAGIASTEMPKSLSALGNGIKEFFIAAIGQSNIDAFKNHFVDYILLQLQIFGQKWKAGWTQMGWDAKVALNNFEVDATNKIRNTMNGLELSITQKLRDIAKAFFDRALGWTQQAKAGFTAGVRGLMDTIGNIVSDINAALKKIITSFTINIKLPDWLTGGSNTPTSSGSGKTGGGGSPKKKASGGNVIAGHVYNVNELGKPEYFIPAQNGRIEPKLEKQTIARIDRRDMEMLADMIVEKALRTA